MSAEVGPGGSVTGVTRARPCSPSPGPVTPGCRPAGSGPARPPHCPAPRARSCVTSTQVYEYVETCLPRWPSAAGAAPGGQAARPRHRLGLVVWRSGTSRMRRCSAPGTGTWPILICRAAHRLLGRRLLGTHRAASRCSTSATTRTPTAPASSVHPAFVSRRSEITAGEITAWPRPHRLAAISSASIAISSWGPGSRSGTGPSMSRDRGHPAAAARRPGAGTPERQRDHELRADHEE